MPSTQDINHIYPLPQPPFSDLNMSETRFFKAPEKKHVLTSNPGRVMVNDVTIGVINTDVVRDMCVNMHNKNPPQNV